MKDMLNIVLMVLSGLIIILTLLQSGKSDGLSSAFTGSGDLNLFAVQKERGPEKFISRMTLVCGILFFAVVIALQVVQ
ncbi:MAG: preprotein translocase subunit SecG [Erysipelotrichaceae bacterium]|nr:preprotein translocase subunit SecG [Erysipelotrichaceae bacterium]